MTIRSIVAILSLSIIILLSCVASEQKTAQSTVTRVDTNATETIAPIGTTSADGYTQDDNMPGQHWYYPREPRSRPPADLNTRTVTLLGQTPAETREVHFAAPALPTPVLDERRRECIGYPIRTSLIKSRMNLLLQPNLYDVSIRNWSNPAWRETFRVAKNELTGLDMFPVPLWRIRGGAPTFWKYAFVQAGPGLPIGNPQTELSASFFRGGDTLCVEAPRDIFISPLLVAEDGIHVLLPHLSMIQKSSNDSTPIPGAWTTISASASASAEVQP